MPASVSETFLTAWSICKPWYQCWLLGEGRAAQFKFEEVTSLAVLHYLLIACSVKSINSKNWMWAAVHDTNKFPLLTVTVASLLTARMQISRVPLVFGYTCNSFHQAGQYHSAIFVIFVTQNQLSLADTSQFAAGKYGLVTSGLKTQKCRW